MPGLLAAYDPLARADLPTRFMRLGSGEAPVQRFAEPGGRAVLGGMGPCQRADDPAGRYRLMLQGELRDPDGLDRALLARGAAGRPSSDAERMLATYLLDGLPGIARLNGAFFMLLWDAERGVLTVGADRHASMPHAYAFEDGRLLLGTSPGAVATACLRQPCASARAISEFLAFGAPLGDRTWFEGVRLFPAGSFLVLGAQGGSFHPYWTPRYSGPFEPRPRDEASWLDEALRCFRTACERATSGPCILATGPSPAERALGVFAGNVPRCGFGPTDVVLRAEADPAIACLEQLAAAGEGLGSARQLAWFTALAARREALPPVVVFGHAGHASLQGAVDALLRPHGPIGRIRQAWQDRHADVAERVYQAARAHSWRVVAPGLVDHVLPPAVARHVRRHAAEGLKEALAGCVGRDPLERLAVFEATQRERRRSAWAIALGGAGLTYRLAFDDSELVDYLLALPAATRSRALPRSLALAQPGRAHGTVSAPGVPAGLAGWLESVLCGREAAGSPLLSRTGVRALLERPQGRWDALIALASLELFQRRYGLTFAEEAA